MKKVLVIIAMLFTHSAMAQYSPGSTYACGLKPIGNAGCRQVCANGRWNEICDQGVNHDNGSIMSCGFKPIGNPGCQQVCVNGNWQEICQ